MPEQAEKGKFIIVFPEGEARLLKVSDVRCIYFETCICTMHTHTEREGEREKLSHRPGEREREREREREIHVFFETWSVCDALRRCVQRSCASVPGCVVWIQRLRIRQGFFVATTASEVQSAWQRAKRCGCTCYHVCFQMLDLVKDMGMLNPWLHGLIKLATWPLSVGGTNILDITGWKLPLPAWNAGSMFHPLSKADDAGFINDLVKEFSGKSLFF